MPDPLAQDDVLSFNPSNPFLTAPDAGGPPPVAASRAAADLQPRIDESGRRSQAAIDLAERSMGLEERNAAAREHELTPLRDRQMEMARQPIPQPPKAKESPPAPQRQNQHDDENWLLAAGLLGSLAGVFTRNHATNALAAFSGALQGYQEGSKQKFDENMQIWNAENKRAQEASQNALAEYRGILENRKLSMEQMSVELQLAAAKHDDRAMQTAAKTKNFLTIAQLHDKQEQALVQMQQSADRLWEQKQRADARDQANRLAQLKLEAEKYAASPEGQARLQSILRGAQPPPSQGQRGTSFVALRDQAISDELSRLGYNFGSYKINQNVEGQRALIPGRAEAAGQTAAARTFNTAGANTEIVMSRAGPVLTNAAEAANAVPATEFKRINQLYQAAEEEISDPAIRNFKVANEELAYLYAAVNNPRASVITVNAVDHARKLIEAADGPEAYDAILHNIQRLAERESENIRRLRAGGQPEPVSIPPISPNRRASVPDLTRKTLERAGGAAESSGLPKTPKYGIGSMVRKPHPAPSSNADMPIMLPEGWKMEQVQ